MSTVLALSAAFAPGLSLGKAVRRPDVRWGSFIRTLSPIGSIEAILGKTRSSVVDSKVDCSETDLTKNVQPLKNNAAGSIQWQQTPLQPNTGGCPILKRVLTRGRLTSPLRAEVHCCAELDFLFGVPTTPVCCKGEFEPVGFSVGGCELL
ncbi:uncharacterized protein BT62DRAFT_999521 [Guyanagaster necrorhizus]|uniref:Uncharacterized protein n=1 Tax=Guyanagaster necrorhizus TaxID=856835 RepID=A0A9P8AXW3_9AGAR|nr:uncharacterized protein BT62DRAFT_999521 [Guyanagaster necrorhizus MCA 3950]KAG7451820.1 hypothetical protein BT62DRAFT_999521 [Guyanagaster necrorhizus MCA 3950]